MKTKHHCKPFLLNVAINTSIFIFNSNEGTMKIIFASFVAVAAADQLAGLDANVDHVCDVRFMIIFWVTSTGIFN
jgi:hypothetical protein